MFGISKKRTEPIQSDTEDVQAPAGYNELANIYYAAFHASDAAMRDASKTLWVYRMLIGALVMGYWLVLPFKTIETRFIEVETASGRAVVAKGPKTDLGEMSERLQLKTREYFLKEFVSALITLDARTIKERVPFAASMLQGKKADNAFNEYVYAIEKIPERIANNPQLTREVQFKGDIAFSADSKLAFVRLNRIEKINGAEQNVTPMLVTLEFAVLPEEPGKEKPLNPLGVRVLYFTVALDN